MLVQPLIFACKKTVDGSVVESGVSNRKHWDTVCDIGVEKNIICTRVSMTEKDQ